MLLGTPLTEKTSPMGHSGQGKAEKREGWCSNIKSTKLRPRNWPLRNQEVVLQKNVISASLIWVGRRFCQLRKSKPLEIRFFLRNELSVTNSLTELPTLSHFSEQDQTCPRLTLLCHNLGKKYPTLSHFLNLDRIRHDRGFTFVTENGQTKSQNYKTPQNLKISKRHKISKFQYA